MLCEHLVGHDHQQGEGGGAIPLNIDDILAPIRKEAEELSRLFAESSWRAVEVVGSIGSGKTTFLERLAEVGVVKGIQMEGLCGDCIGDDDAMRLVSAGINAEPIETGRDCHLAPHHIAHAVRHLTLDHPDTEGLLVVENVGNLVCPADFPLGADVRMAVVAATEGADTIAKHRMLLGVVDILVVAKSDIAGVCGVDLKDFDSQVKKWLGDIPVFYLNLKEERLPDELLGLVEPRLVN